LGKLRSELVPLIDPRRFSLASVESAYDALRDRNAQGKIVIDVAGVRSVLDRRTAC
jgi:hypothetical protein